MMRQAARDFFLAREWRGRAYLISPFFDLLCCGGLALLAFSLLLILLPPGSEQFASQKLTVVALTGGLAFFVNDPHFIASYQLLYRGYPAKLRRFRAERELWLRYIIAGIAAPGVMALYFLYAMASGQLALFGYAIVAMFFVVGWHYVKQAYGIFIMLSVMKGVYYSPSQRQALLANCYLVWGMYCLSIVTQTARQAGTAWGVDYAFPQLFLLPPVVLDLLWGAFLLSALATLLIAAWERQRPPYSKTALLGYFSMYYLLFLGALHPLWILLYPFFHSLQYLMFVYAYKRGETQVNARKAAAQAYKQAKRFALVAFFAGMLCFELAPFALEGLVNPATHLVFPIAASVIVFINIHHYFIDNVIWRKEHAELRTYLFTR